MAKLHFVRKARKSYKRWGIRKGQSYWFWYKMGAGRFSGKICSTSRPPRSAYLTSSPYTGAMMDLEDRFNGIDPEEGALEVSSVLEDLASEVRDLGSECGDKVDGMSSAFPNGCPTLELLQARVDACEALARALDDAAGVLDGESTREDVEAALAGIDWTYE